MNRLTKAALAGLAVALTGPIGLIAISVYYLRKNYEQQQKQRGRALLSLLGGEHHRGRLACLRYQQCR